MKNYLEDGYNNLCILNGVTSTVSWVKAKATVALSDNYNLLEMKQMIICFPKPISIL